MPLILPKLSPKSSKRKTVAAAGIRTVDSLRYYDGDEWTVLTSDLSGFTRTVREHGIVFFAAIIVQMRHLLRCCWEHYDAVSIEVEGDDFIVVFSNSTDAVRAALEGVRIIREFNATVPSPEFAINLSGFGLASGAGLVQSLRSGKLFGRVADESFLLGEHICTNAKILCTRAVAKALSSHADFADLRAIRQVGHDERVDFDFFALEGDFREHVVSPPAPPASPDKDHTPRDAFLRAVMLERPRRGAEVAAFDQQLAAEYGLDCYCLLVGYDWAWVTRRHGVQNTVMVVDLAVTLMQKCAQRFGAELLEEHIFSIKDAETAVLLGLAIQENVRAHNKSAQDNRRIPFLGAAVHHGMLLVVEDEFYSGDPVTTTSKIAEDSVQDGSLHITHRVHRALKGKTLEPRLRLRACEFNVSNVRLPCFRVEVHDG
jgi:class 3 adenylate cyclase